MNNYLAKPVRANVLKQMLEGYLNQVPKTITNLQQQANLLSQEVLNEASMYTPPTTTNAGVDGKEAEGEKDGQETPTPATVNPAMPALPSRSKSAFKVAK